MEGMMILVCKDNCLEGDVKVDPILTAPGQTATVNGRVLTDDSDIVPAVLAIAIYPHVEFEGVVTQVDLLPSGAHMLTLEDLSDNEIPSHLYPQAGTIQMGVCFSDECAAMRCPLQSQ